MTHFYIFIISEDWCVSLVFIQLLTSPPYLNSSECISLHVFLIEIYFEIKKLKINGSKGLVYTDGLPKLIPYCNPRPNSMCVRARVCVDR